MKLPIDLKELEIFLNEANKSTYANKDAPKTASLRPRSDDYHYESGDLAYHDTYFGARDFMGEEVVYKSNRPVWGMNYFGFILSPEIKEKEVYDFLRLALMADSFGVIPIRGPREFSKDGWAYFLFVDGGLDNFSGKEEISKDNKLIYKAFLHGGFIR